MIIRVINAADLKAKLAAAKGGEEFVLAPGDYGVVTLKNRNFDSAITIRSEQLGQQARIGQIVLTASNGIKISQVELGLPLATGEGRNVNSAAVVINRSERVDVSNVHVHGFNKEEPTNNRYGISVMASKSISISDSQFDTLSRGIVVSGTDGISIKGNRLTDLGVDGFDFADVRNVVIDSNYLTNFRPAAGQHPDAIQFWTSNTTRPSTDITIKNNQILQGSGASVQGIFLRDETNTLPYERVSIINNVVYEDTYNGILVSNGKSVVIASNTVLSRQGDGIQARIYAGTITGSVDRNVADIFLNSAGSGLSVGTNVFLSQDPSKVKLIPNLTKGALTTINDLVMPNFGYHPVGGVTGPMLADTSASQTSSTAVKATTSDVLSSISVGKGDPETASKNLLDIEVVDGKVTDLSPYGSLLSNNGAANIDAGGVGYRLAGNNGFEVTKAKASQLFGLDQFTLSFNVSRQAVGSGDGHLMRIHNSWYLSTTASGELQFEYNPAGGKSIKVVSSGARLSDLATHQVQLSFDAKAGNLAFYVDGRPAGGGAINGGTKQVESWGLYIGNPFGSSFKGKIGSINLTAGATTAQQAVDAYTASQILAPTSALGISLVAGTSATSGKPTQVLADTLTSVSLPMLAEATHTNLVDPFATAAMEGGLAPVSSAAAIASRASLVRLDYMLHA